MNAAQGTVIAQRADDAGGSDPVTRLTPRERAFVARLEAEKNRDEVLAELKANLQTALEIELATIPIYLFTYYSIVRTATTGEGIDPVQAYANKAGAVIMSVAVEEMLHMSLVGNVLYAMGVEPQLHSQAPAAYPASLPYHNPQGPPGPDGKTAEKVPLGKFSFAQLWHFLQIEYPEPWNGEPKDRDWDTIGQFYSYIRCLLATSFLRDEDFRQGPAARAIQPGNYSPNSTDTVYTTGKYDPWKPAPSARQPEWAGADCYPSAAGTARFANRDDSHTGKSALLSIRSIADAASAIDTICDQGEGQPVPGIGPSPYDDPSKDEESHYLKFLTLQAQFQDYQGTRETLPATPRPPSPQLPTISDGALQEAGLVIDFPDNPTTASYGPLGPVSDFCNACFEYMLMMTETIYRVPPEQQKLFFNEALHRSMIWVLDSYIHAMSGIELPSGQFMAPTFERYDLGSKKEAFKRLCEAGERAVAAAPPSAQGSIQGCVDTATKVALDSPRMCLPDIAQYW
jgi:hypothetical protein